MIDLTRPVKVEKRPGYDWTITFQWEDGEPEAMAVFGVLTIEEAVREARSSLESIEEDPEWPGYEIIAVARGS